jgi:hypothetical protein
MMTKTSLIVPGFILAGVALWASTLTTTAAQQPSPSTPSYTSSGELTRPTDFREWVFLSSGLGMT